MSPLLVRNPSRGGWLLGPALLLASLLGVITAATGVWAQQKPHPLLWQGDRPHPKDLTQRAVSEFDLFGAADLALIGMRGRGSMIHSLPNNGPIDYYFVLSSSIVTELNTPVGQSQMYFMGPLWAGTPQSEWNKHRATVSSLNNVSGGGWNSHWNLNAFFLQFPNKWRAADGQLGLVHSGAANTNDGTCTDFTGDFVNTGTPLMAASDCPETWGSDQFAGAGRLIEFTSWVDYFNQVGAANFTWDWWQVPPEFVSDELIGDFQSYGKIVDWASDNLVRFGNAIPDGTGSPEVQGWPLGLTLDFDVFSFANPDVANTTYWRATLTNESREVYGVPLDYDSLYFGNDFGLLMNTQLNAVYFRPELGGMFATNSGVTPNCNNGRVPAGNIGCIGSGFDVGGTAILVLNSPIGDLRNKTFSDPNSPFFAEDHPRAGDTITFNQGRICAFGGCWANTTNRSARSGFGLHSAIPVDVLDGRSEADFDATGGTTWWRTFRNYDYPTRTARFNKLVPGNWDWNEDGVQDTLFLDSCLGPEFGAPATGGCAELWSDTLPGGLVNDHTNFGGFIGVGPIRLAAGETTRWTIAVVTGGTRSAIEANARNAVGFYVGSYLGPEAVPPPRIVSIATTPGDRARTPGASVQIFLDDTPEQAEDVFMLLQASQLEGSTLAADNPFLVDSIRAVARNNVEAVHIFKSCDFGTTFTADNDCDGDPAVDDRGNSVGAGWRPFATFEPDENGRFPNVFIDNAVTAGKTYLYSIVTESRGLSLNVVERDAVGNPIPGQLDVAPKLYSVLSTSASDPNVALVYVSASRQAGGRPAEVTFTQDDPVAPTDFHPVNVIITSDIEESASYRVVFGDSVVVTEQVDASSGEVSSATVDVFRTVITSLDGGASLTRIAFDSVSYSTTNPAGVQVAGGVTSETSGTDPIVRTTIYADELTLVALDASDNPLFTSSVLDGSGTTPGLFFGRPDFPRWFLSVDNTQAGMLDSVAWREAVGPDSVETLRALGSPTLTWLDELSTPTGEGFGEYLFEWDDSEYGPGRTFTIDVANPEVTEALFQASLEQRQVATETSTSAEVAAALGVTTDDLAQVKLPFRVLHSAPNRDVTVAMLATSKLESIALGRDVDQVQVDVPADQWVPGEALVFVETVSTFQRAVGAAGEYVVTQAGQPVVVDTQLVTWSSATLGCPGRPTCNAVTAGTRGADAAAHLALNPGVQMLRVRYFNAYSPQTSYVFEISKTISGADATEIEPEDLENIRVVPNPYVVFSVYEQRIGERRLMFTGLPPRGTIEIYTVSGQFVQRISYTESDLAGNGDLYWNMRTRENTDIASGLYIFVVRGILPATGEQVKKLGKFVVIR